MDITFLRPTAPGPGPWSSVPAPGSIYFFTVPGPNYLFTAPNDGITFSQPPSIKHYHVFFTPLNKTQPTVYSKIPFQLQCESTDCFLHDVTWKLFLILSEN